MSLVQSVVYDSNLAKWLVTLTGPAVASDSFSISVTHSGGFSGFLPIYDGTSPASNYTTVRFSDYKGVAYSGTTSFTISLVSGAAPPLSGTITLTVGEVSGTWSYNNTPITTSPGVGSANQATTEFPFDYSNHLDRIITALDQIAVASASIASSLNAITMSTDNSNSLISSIADSQSTIATKTTTIADKQTTIADKQTTIATNSTTIADKQTAMETYQKKLKELGEGSGIHFTGPYEVFGLVSIYRLMIEQAKILESTGITATPEQVTQALVEVERISDLIKTTISKDF